MQKTQRDLVFDLGVNEGLDTAFYLRKGFRVVAVEANPLFHDTLNDKFGDFVQSGQCTLVNQGVWHEPTNLTFYANKTNDHWSSFIKEVGTRANTAYEEMQVSCTTIGDLFKTYGIPHYLKIDIEGADRVVVECMKSEKNVPTFVSIEQYGLDAFDDLSAIGYQSFMIVQQGDKSCQTPPRRAREGRFVGRTFTDRDSGLFGYELPGPWLTLAAAKEY